MTLSFPLPNWFKKYAHELEATPFSSDAERMAAVIELAAENIRRGSGGPFGAAVFDCSDGRCVAAGINVVLSARCSHLHAEMVALARAQQTLATHDLATAGRFALFTSVEPCAMCMGATVWSGVMRLVCGATTADAEAIGFDEGPKPEDWPETLQHRGIRVRRNLLRAQARAVLHTYAASGAIYNAQRDADSCSHTHLLITKKESHQ